MKKLIVPILFLSLLSVSCGSKKDKQKEETVEIKATEIVETADSTAVETAVEVKDSITVVVEAIKDSIE